MADRYTMGSQLLAESLGRDPRFEITWLIGSAATGSAWRDRVDVAVISVNPDTAAGRGLQIARALNARQPHIRLVEPEEDLREFRHRGLSLWSNRRVLPNGTPI